MFFLAVYFAVAVVSAVAAFRVSDRPGPGAKKIWPFKSIWPAVAGSVVGLVLLKAGPHQNLPEVGLPFTMHLVMLLVAFAAGWFIGVIARTLA